MGLNEKHFADTIPFIDDGLYVHMRENCIFLCRVSKQGCQIAARIEMRGQRAFTNFLTAAT